LVLAESYFDETNTHKGDDRLCIGGYIFLKEAAEQQTAEWGELLAKWNLPYFHMVDCAHNVGVFEHLTKDECDFAAREAIAIIKSTASAGICMTVLESEYDEIVPSVKFFGSAYDALARHITSGVASWIEKANFEGQMHYFFEAGVASENNASYCIMRMMSDPEIGRDARYSGHSFVRKECSPGVQAADILAWHAGQDCKRALAGKPKRRDFESLSEIPHWCVHFTTAMLKDMAQIIIGNLQGAGLTPELANELDRLERSGKFRKI
jgi:hypothetical protein